MSETTLHISKASFMMGVWGLAILVASMVNQWFTPPNTDFLLLMWGLATLVGLGAHLISMVKGLGLNLGAWIGVVLVGWGFTLYVIKLDNGAHMDMFGDMAGVWLILLGLGYVATAFQVDKRFLIIAALHLAAGVILELSARRVVVVDAIDANSTLIFGLVGGLTLIVAALPFWYAPARNSQQIAQSGLVR